MACLQEQTPEGRSGVVQCDEKGCKFRRVALGDGWNIDEDSPETDCVLQLRLRAGDAADFSFPVQPLGNGLVANVDEGNGVYAFEDKRVPAVVKSGVLYEIQQASKKASPISERTDGQPGPKTLAKLFADAEVRLHSISIDPVPLDPACTIEVVEKKDPLDGKHIPSTWRGPRVNHVYLDEYQRWVGKWEETETDIFSDFDIDANKYVMLCEPRLLVMPAIEADTSSWWKHNSEDHLIRGEN